MRGEPEAAGVFRVAVRRNFLPFLGYEVVLVVLARILSQAVWVFPSLASLWVEPVLMLPLALGFVAITCDGVGTREAVKRSMRTVLRYFPAGLALLLVSFAVHVLVYLYRTALSAQTNLQADLSGHRLWWIGADHLIGGMALILLGVWLALAQFLWYENANPAPVPAVEEVDTSDGGSDATTVG